MGEDFARLLSHDAGIVGGAYRKKDDVEKYPVEIVHGAQDNNGLLEARYLPTGFMRIRRDALATVIEKYGPDNRCLYKMPDGSRREVLHLFAMGRAYHGNEDVPSYVGEDVHFCNIARMVGVKCWVDPDITLSHTGEKTWVGDYAAYRQRMEAQEAEKQGE
jgi:hypothetical protein